MRIRTGVRLRGHCLLHGERRLAGQQRVALLRARSAKDRLQTVAGLPSTVPSNRRTASTMAATAGCSRPPLARHRGRRSFRSNRRYRRTAQWLACVRLAARRGSGAAGARRTSRRNALPEATAPALGAHGVERDAAVRAELVCRIFSRAIGASHGSISSSPASLLVRPFPIRRLFRSLAHHTNVQRPHNLTFWKDPWSRRG